MFAWVLVCVCAGGQARNDSGLTQRRINGFAASLETAQSVILEASPLRGAKEPLPAYLSRLAARQANETEAQRETRIGGYLSALQMVAEGTAVLRKIPTLHDMTEANRRVWQSVVGALDALPPQMNRLRSAWNRERAAAGKPAKTGANQFTGELVRTLYITVTARDGLRDARP